MIVIKLKKVNERHAERKTETMIDYHKWPLRKIQICVYVKIYYKWLS